MLKLKKKTFEVLPPTFIDVNFRCSLKSGLTCETVSVIQPQSNS